MDDLDRQARLKTIEKFKITLAVAFQKGYIEKSGAMCLTAFLEGGEFFLDTFAKGDHKLFSVLMELYTLIEREGATLN